MKNDKKWSQEGENLKNMKLAKSLKNHEKLTKNGAQIHQKSIKNRSKNRRRKMDVPKSIKIDFLSAKG